MPQPEYVQRGYLREDFRLFHLKGPMEEQLDWHYHTFHKLIFFLGGTSSYGLEGRSYPLEAGDVILVPQGCVHRPEAAPGAPYEGIIRRSAAPTAASSASRRAAPDEPPGPEKSKKALDTPAPIWYDSKAEFVRVPRV